MMTMMIIMMMMMTTTMSITIFEVMMMMMITNPFAQPQPSQHTTTIPNRSTNLRKQPTERAINQ